MPVTGLISLKHHYFHYILLLLRLLLLLLLILPVILPSIPEYYITLKGTVYNKNG